MLSIWNRVFSDGRQAELAGDGPERMLDACDKLLFNGADPAIGVELPLLGTPSYDTLVILPTQILKPGCRLRDSDPRLPSLFSLPFAVNLAACTTTAHAACVRHP